jgi:hypothetical protein
MEFRYSNTCQVYVSFPCIVQLITPVQGTAYGKQFFIGCSEWTRALKLEHRYLPIPTNVDEDTLRIAMENGGQLPTAPTVNEMCALTVHPRIGKSLQTCRR